MEFKFGDKKIGGNSPVFIVAELSANHGNSLAVAKKSIKAIKEAGADAVKLQTYTADTMTVDSNKEYFKIKQNTIWDGQNLYKLYDEAHTPWEWHAELKKTADDLGLILFSAPFDKTAVDFLENLNVPAYKIASFEITDIPLIEYAASKKKPIILSTGISEPADIKEAIDACKRVGNKDIIVLKCTSSYPAPFDEMNLNTIPDMSKKFNVITGLSDHTLGFEIPIAATVLGAKMIEKHFILDRSIGGPDASFSLEANDFKSMVDSIRNVEKALGKVSYKLSEKAKKNRELSRSLFVVKDIKKGEVFTEENVRSIRPGFGLPPKMVKEILGKKATTDIERGEPMKKVFYK